MQLHSALSVWRTLKQDQTTLFHTTPASPASLPGANFTPGNASSSGDPIQPLTRAPQQYLCSAAPARSSCRWPGTSACWSPAARSQGCRRSAPRAPPGTSCQTCVRQLGLAGQDRTQPELWGRDQARGGPQVAPPAAAGFSCFPSPPVPCGSIRRDAQTTARASALGIPSGGLEWSPPRPLPTAGLTG